MTASKRDIETPPSLTSSTIVSDEHLGEFVHLGAPVMPFTTPAPITTTTTTTTGIVEAPLRRSSEPQTFQEKANVDDTAREKEFSLGVAGVMPVGHKRRAHTDQEVDKKGDSVQQFLLDDIEGDQQQPQQQQGGGEEGNYYDEGEGEEDDAEVESDGEGEVEFDPLSGNIIESYHGGQLRDIPRVKQRDPLEVGDGGGGHLDVDRKSKRHSMNPMTMKANRKKIGGGGRGKSSLSLRHTKTGEGGTDFASRELEREKGVHGADVYTSSTTPSSSSRSKGAPVGRRSSKRKYGVRNTPFFQIDYSTKGTYILFKLAN